jgi:hypothetical protein
MAQKLSCLSEHVGYKRPISICYAKKQPAYSDKTKMRTTVSHRDCPTVMQRVAFYVHRCAQTDPRDSAPFIGSH